MVVLTLDIDDLLPCIRATFDGDSEIIKLYDKTVNVESIDAVSESIFEKINSLDEVVNLRGVCINGEAIGYFVFTPGSLISFGLNINHRTKEKLQDFWEVIKSEVGDEFSCVLFDYNKRAIKWLRKMGMETIFENLTVLRCQQ